METEREFAEEIERIRTQGEPQGSALLATTFSVEDIAIARMIMRCIRDSIKTTRDALEQSEHNKAFVDWINRHGALQAARIVAIVARTST